MLGNLSSGSPTHNGSHFTDELVNITHEDCLSADSTAVTAVKAMAYFAILLVSLVGNVLVILVIYKNTQLRKSINYFVFNMAVSDLFTPLTIMPIKVVEIISGSDEFRVNSPLILGNILCKLCYFLPDVSVYVSIESLLLISMDRFVAIVFPLKAKLISSKVRFICILCTWLIAAAIHAPYFYTFRLFPYLNETYVCRQKWEPAFDGESHSRFVTATFIAFIPVPICILVIVYGTIAWTLKRNQKRRRNICASYPRRKYQRNRPVLLLSVAIITAFVACTVPLLVFMFTTIFLWRWHKPPICAFRTVIPFIAFFCLQSWSAVNPIICFMFSKNYRSGLKELFLFVQQGSLQTETALIMTTPV